MFLENIQFSIPSKSPSLEPPIQSFFSYIITDLPDLERFIAAVIPAIPAPTIWVLEFSFFINERLL